MRDAADGVLNQPQYLDAARPPSLRDRLIDWVAEFFTDIFRSLSTVGGRGVFAWVIVGLFVAVIVFLLTRIRPGGGARRPIVGGPAIDVQRDLTASQWRSEADSHEANGDWRSGLRCRHRALVAELIDRDSISARPGQTAGEVAQTVSTQVPQASESIDVATRLFADVWYGGATATAQTNDRFERHSAAVVAAVDAAVGTARSAPNEEPVPA